MASGDKQVDAFLIGKSAHTQQLFAHFIECFNSIGPVKLHATKTMIAIANNTKNIAWITQLGKNFVHVVFSFKEAHENNFCFQKIAQVPGDAKQFNHHLRLLLPEDVNAEVMAYMKKAYTGQ